MDLLETGEGDDLEAPRDRDDLGPAPERISVEQGLVEELVARQFPHWSYLPVEPVADGGWDNVTFHLGSEMLVRLPSAAEYALAVDKEHQWLPMLARQLPRPIPMPLAKGRPGAGYPFPWSVYAWLPGTTATFDQVADPVPFAEDLADVVAALQRVDTTDGPRPGKHNWYRGGTLRRFQRLIDDALGDLEGHVETDLALQIWQAALRAEWDGVDRWFHGDLAQGNLLLVDGQLAAVLDFGTCGVGDPACDMAVAWTLLSADGRQAFRRQLAVDDATWARGRGWALWKTLTVCANTLGNSDEAAVDAQRALAEVLTA